MQRTPMVSCASCTGCASSRTSAYKHMKRTCYRISYHNCVTQRIGNYIPGLSIHCFRNRARLVWTFSCLTPTANSRFATHDSSRPTHRSGRLPFLLEKTLLGKLAIWHHSESAPARRSLQGPPIHYTLPANRGLVDPPVHRWCLVSGLRTWGSAAWPCSQSHPALFHREPTPKGTVVWGTVALIFNCSAPSPDYVRIPADLAASRTDT